MRWDCVRVDGFSSSWRPVKDVVSNWSTVGSDRGNGGGWGRLHAVGCDGQSSTVIYSVDSRSRTSRTSTIRVRIMTTQRDTHWSGSWGINQSEIGDTSMESLSSDRPHQCGVISLSMRRINYRIPSQHAVQKCKHTSSLKIPLTCGSSVLLDYCKVLPTVFLCNAMAPAMASQHPSAWSDTFSAISVSFVLRSIADWLRPQASYRRLVLDHTVCCLVAGWSNRKRRHWKSGRLGLIEFSSGVKYLQPFTISSDAWWSVWLLLGDSCYSRSK